MGKMEQALRYEISRLARKEIRATCGPLGRDVRELKRTVSKLTRQVEKLQKLRSQITEQQVAEKAKLEAPDEEVRKARFSPGLIKKLRKRLGITQAEMATLIDASPATVAFWEQGRTRPTMDNRAALVALRKLGKRDVARILAEKSAQAG
ncbi:MAG: helix-turn-helix domain-containing protein [Candidatus Brocadiia bacterium]